MDGWIDRPKASRSKLLHDLPPYIQELGEERTKGYPKSLKSFLVVADQAAATATTATTAQCRFYAVSEPALRRSNLV